MNLGSHFSGRLSTGLLLCGLLSAGLASCFPSARKHFVQTPMTADSLQTFSYDVEEYKEKYEGHDGVFIRSSSVVDHATAGEIWYAYLSNSLRFMILNKDAEWLSTFTLRIYPDERLESVYITVMSVDGKARSYGVEDFNVERNSDGSETYRFAYPDIEVGSVVDEGYVVKYTNGSDLMKHEFDLEFQIPTEHVLARFIYPNLFSVRKKEIGPGRKLDTEYDNSYKGARAIVYERRDVPAFPDERYSPYKKEVAEYLQVAITGAGGTTFLPSWSKYADGFGDIVLERESFWRDRAGSVVEEIVDDSMSDYEKLDAVVGWIYQNIKTEPVPSDYDFNDVIKEKVGTPNLISGLARLMLQKADLDASFLLVHSAFNGYFDEDFITYGELVNPALYTRIDGKEYVVLPYVKNYPIDQIPEYMQGQEALAINEDGFNGFVTVPITGGEANTVTETYNLDIDEEGVIAVSEQKVLNGTAAYSIRRVLEDLSEDELEELMEGLISYEEDDVKLDSYEIENQDDYRKPLKIELKYQIDNLVTITPEEVILQTGGLLSPVSSTGTKIETDKRVTPIRIYFEENLVKNITLNYPTSWRFNTDLKRVDFENDFGALKVTWSDRSGETEIEMRRTLKQSNEPAERFDDLMEIIGARSRHLNVPAIIFAVD